MTLDCNRNSEVSLTLNGDTIKNGSYVQNLLDAIFLPGALAIKILGHSKLDSLEAKGNHLTDIFPPRTLLSLKGINSQTSVMVQRNVPPNANLEKLIRDT